MFTRLSNQIDIFYIIISQYNQRKGQRKTSATKKDTLVYVNFYVVKC